MKRVIVDSKENIVFEGVEAKEIFRILNADVYNVSEENEVKYEHIFRPLVELKDLKYEVHFDVKFRGIDDWYRPVFKDIDSSLYFGDTEKLWTAKEAGEDFKILKDYYKSNPEVLQYFGSSFDCEPHGGIQKNFKFNIL